uniref:RNase H type-1 domain-containing protein n=1 Tax=Ananas comosus var. bracteatus TaxID=296719 RepID=A0A6V7PPQ3_ANACO|nr:unnamed protein product [Ananas comosus var. bracteatus]
MASDSNRDFSKSGSSPSRIRTISPKPSRISSARNPVPPSASSSGRRQSPDRAALLPRPRASLQWSLLRHPRPASSSAAVLRPVAPSGLGILGPPPPQPPPADLQEDGGAASPPPPDFELVVSWRPPPDGWVKLNTDGSFVGRGSSGGAGFVARDSEGLFVFAGTSSCPGVNPLYSELWAIRAALTRAIEAGFPRVLLESDSSSAVDLLGGRIKNAPRGTKQLVQDCLALRCRFARSSSSTHTGRATGWPTASPPWAADRDRIASTCISTICPTPSPETASCSIFAAAPPCARASFTTSVV